MSRARFGEAFDGYCVVHAPFIAPERRVWFEAELGRAGVEDFVVVETEATGEDDPRLANYEQTQANGYSMLSVGDGYKRCIDVAEQRGWRDVVIFEDDVLFRGDFERRWAEVAPSAREREWDVLFFYRWRRIPIAELRPSTRITRIRSNICLHGFAVRRGFFDRFREAVDYAFAEGAPIDVRAIYRYFARHDARIFATTRNLVGQMGGLQSRVSARERGQSRVEMFRVRRPTDLSWHVRRARRALERRAGRLRGAIASALLR